MDTQILIWIQEYLRNDILNPIMIFITYLGEYGALWMVLCLFFICIKKTRRAGIVCAFSLLVEAVITNLILKPLVARTRPYEVIDELVLLVKKANDYSFPSGHAGAAFAVAMVCFFMLPRRFGVGVLILAALIAFSRLYVAIHYPTDVLAGVLIGTGSAVFGCFINKILKNHKKKNA
ncbi:phosphatase PAP2 family protein [Eubacterium oxidoreducens]|uniref:Undecaprenyl-diphosphatase n=1 Tax=Eubacterium oxidoreducens TaxID=1732 RepID=A0A1G6BG17_EUBOX|nr:phosphatase PAP2 family protein [Eubacterium oxidoreducens]SDB19509.1 undecaprenyl-diphosphatase [Eubacterium oxidoreducens]